MKFHVTSKWIDAHSSVSRCKNAEIAIDTALEGNLEAFNPAELLLSALTACMIKGIMRVSPILDFKLNGLKSSSTVFVKMFRRRWSRSITKSSSIPMRAMTA